MNFERLTKSEQNILKSLHTPDKIQAFIDTKIQYDPYREDRSIREVIKNRKAECFNGALSAAACLLFHGYWVRLVQLNARGDEEHILCVYKQNGMFGTISQSKILGLKSRHPIYLTIRDLVASYKEFYFGWDGHFALINYTKSLSLTQWNYKWLYDSSCVIEIGRTLAKSKKYDIVKLDTPPEYVSSERYWREVLLVPKGSLIPKKYLFAKPKHKKIIWV